jgi:hypothetical protein
MIMTTIQAGALGILLIAQLEAARLLPGLFSMVPGPARPGGLLAVDFRLGLPALAQ